MKNLITAIILRKNLIKEHHLLLTVLTAEGEKLSLLMMGGQGGKKSHARANILELGNIIQFVPVISKKNGATQELMQGKEWVLLWQHQKLRYDFKKFQILYDWLSIIEKVSLDAPIENFNRSQSIGALYLHLSNAIVTLDRMDVQLNPRALEQVKIFYLLRLCYILGVSPRTDECIMCLSPLTFQSGVRSLVIDAGGFICHLCQGVKSEDHFDLWMSWKMSMHLNWKKMDSFNLEGMKYNYELVRNYSAHHLSLSWREVELS